MKADAHSKAMKRLSSLPEFVPARIGRKYGTSLDDFPQRLEYGYRGLDYFFYKPRVNMTVQTLVPNFRI